MNREFLTEEQRKRYRRRGRLKITVWIVLILGLFVGVVYVVFFSPLLRVKKIEVSGSVYVSAADIERSARQIAGENVFWKNIIAPDHFLVWRNLSAERLQDALPALKNVRINREYFKHAIAIAVEERSRVAVWCSQSTRQISEETSTPAIIEEECYWFDETGRILEASPRAEGSLIISITDYSGAKITPGMHVLNSEQFIVVKSILRLLEELRVSINEVKILRPELHELIVSTYDGPELRFSLDFNPSPLKEPLQKIKNTAGFKNLQYVDLRVENRIYYK